MCTILQEQFSFLANSEDVAVRMHFKDFFLQIISNIIVIGWSSSLLGYKRERERESDDDEKCRAKTVLKVNNNMLWLKYKNLNLSVLAMKLILLAHFTPWTAKEKSTKRWTAAEAVLIFSSYSS